MHLSCTNISIVLEGRREESKNRRDGAFSSNHIERAFGSSYPLIILDLYSPTQFAKKESFTIL